jgi:hypothetical protein
VSEALHNPLAPLTTCARARCNFHIIVAALRSLFLFSVVLAADRGRFERCAAAKQEAFEESTKLTNQFRSLDEDEIEFLDSVQEAARAKELADKRATKEGLEEFRKQQEEAERAAKEQEGAVSPPTVSESWAVGPRKRKKGKEKDVIGGLKIRRTSTGERAKEVEGTREFSTTKVDDHVVPSSVAQPSVQPRSDKQPTTAAPASPPAPATGLGLGAYSSSDED